MRPSAILIVVPRLRSGRAPACIEHLGVGYLSAYSQHHGFEPEIVDASFLDASVEQIADCALHGWCG